jgi:hypothetical protein
MRLLQAAKGECFRPCKGNHNCRAIIPSNASLCMQACLLTNLLTYLHGLEEPSAHNMRTWAVYFITGGTAKQVSLALLAA